MNEESHWDGISPRYDSEIFDVFASDRNRRLGYYFSRHANPNHTAIDFGCGVGKAFPYLAPAFKQVVAIDISEGCLQQARKKPFSNISFLQADLSKPRLKLPPAEFIFCCNVIMLPEPEKNKVMIKNMQRSLNGGGHGLVVIPSAESILFTTWRMMEWYGREGVAAGKIPEAEFSYYKESKRNLLQGLFQIENVTTKHYLQPELQVLFKEAGFEVTAIERLEYEWNTEFEKPPRWMKAPYPWDWLVECSKLG